MADIAPYKIRYIKLGANGCWEASALDGGRLQWGVSTDPHDLAAAGHWAGLADAYRGAGHVASTVTGYVNEARAFYDHDPNALWITFARGRMWWAFAEPEVHWVGGEGKGEGTRYRVIPGGWRDQDASGQALEMERLSTRLTRVAGYRRTICGLDADQQALCLRYINAAADPEHQAVMDARANLRLGLSALIRRLTWRDFEQLVDLVLARSGWLRVSGLGGTGKDIDLVVQQPLTGERMSVQVKSSATQQVVDDYARRLDLRAVTERRMLICHSPTGQLEAPPAQAGHQLELLLADQVTDLAIGAGLVDWVVERAR